MPSSVTSVIQPEISITNESFDAGHAHRYSLLLQITDGGLSFMVLSHATNKFIILRDYQFSPPDMHQKLKEIFSTSEYIARVKYKTVTVSIATSKTTLVPSPFYDSTDRRKLLEFNHSLKADDVIYSNYVRAFDMYNVFAIPKELDDLMKSYFTGFNLLHSATPFIQGVHLEFRNEALPGLFVNVGKKSFEVLAIKEKQLLFYNNFSYETAEDFVYYILFVAEQLRINPELNPLTLSGNIQKEGPLYAGIHRYFRHVNFAERPEQYKYYYEFENIPSHIYFSLFSQSLCE